MLSEPKTFLPMTLMQAVFHLMMTENWVHLQIFRGPNLTGKKFLLHIVDIIDLEIPLSCIHLKSILRYWIILSKNRYFKRRNI